MVAAAAVAEEEDEALYPEKSRFRRRLAGC